MLMSTTVCDMPNVIICFCFDFCDDYVLVSFSEVVTRIAARKCVVSSVRVHKLLLPLSVFLFTLISTVWHSHCRCLCPRALLIRSVCPVKQPGLSVSQAVCQSVSEALSRFPQLPAPPLFVCVFLLLFRFCFCCYCFKRNFPLV